jgi:C_GCAxxG_C_C family probable redox protein
MNKSDTALEYFKNGYNCSQAVFSAFAPEFGLDDDLSLKIACGFGSGIGGLQETCGAVTGACMAIGLKCGRGKSGDNAMKENTYRKIIEFTNNFKQAHGTIKCRDLIRVDISTQDGLKRARENGIFTTLCAKYVRDAAEILEKIL